jgi:hypothetical protein
MLLLSFIFLSYEQVERILIINKRCKFREPLEVNERNILTRESYRVAVDASDAKKTKNMN